VKTQQRTQARKNAWSRPAPWANVRRKPAAPIVTEATPAPVKPVVAPVEPKPIAISNGIPAEDPTIYGLQVDVPASPVEFIKVDRSPGKSEPTANPAAPAPAKAPASPETIKVVPELSSDRSCESKPTAGEPKPKKPVAIMTTFKMPAPVTPVERRSWTVKVEEVNWYEANEEVAVVASPEAPSPVAPESSPKATASDWTTVAQRRTSAKRWQRAGNDSPRAQRGNRSPRVRSSPGPNRRGYGYRPRQQQERNSAHQHRGFRHGHQQKREYRQRPVWKKVGSTDSLGSDRRVPSRQVSPTPSSISEQSFARADSGSSQTLSCETSSSSPQAPAMEPCPPRRSDPQVMTVLKKMESLGGSGSAWADEDEEMDW